MALVGLRKAARWRAIVLRVRGVAPLSWQSAFPITVTQLPDTPLLQSFNTANSLKQTTHRLSDSELRSGLLLGVLTVPEGEAILLVEDEQMVRKFARHVLEISGYVVSEASNGAQAIQLCSATSRPFSLLLTDVVMPNLSGPQLREEVMKICPEMRVLYMSGYPDQVCASHGLRADVMPFLQKPFSPDALVRKVREVLNASPGEATIESVS